MRVSLSFLHKLVVFRGRQIAMCEWKPYKANIPKKKNAPSNSAELKIVHHVVHLPTARQILEDGKIRAGLVYDESRLKTSRISVNWLSANTWVDGSIYGNIQFSYSWNYIIDGCHFYWVEDMKKYTPTAYRILITDRNLKNKNVTPYDPSSDLGPLRKRNGVWYWNEEYTSEFMVDRDLDLSDCVSLDFISHNYKICRTYGRDCRDKSTPRYKIGGQSLAFMLGNGVHSVDHVLKQPSKFDPSRQLSDVIDHGIYGILSKFGNEKTDFRGEVTKRQPRKAVIRGALSLYAAGQETSAQQLLKLLKSEEILEKGLQDIVNDHFNVSGWRIEE